MINITNTEQIGTILQIKLNFKDPFNKKKEKNHLIYFQINFKVINQLFQILKLQKKKINNKFIIPKHQIN